MEGHKQDLLSNYPTIALIAVSFFLILWQREIVHTMLRKNWSNILAKWLPRTKFLTQRQKSIYMILSASMTWIRQLRPKATLMRRKIDFPGQWGSYWLGGGGECLHNAITSSSSNSLTAPTDFLYQPHPALSFIRLRIEAQKLFFNFAHPPRALCLEYVYSHILPLYLLWTWIYCHLMSTSYI